MISQRLTLRKGLRHRPTWCNSQSWEAEFQSGFHSSAAFSLDAAVLTCDLVLMSIIASALRVHWLFRARPTRVE